MSGATIAMASQQAELLGWLNQYVLGTDVPALAKSCADRGYRSASDLVDAGELTLKWLAELGVSTGPARRMLLRELRRMERAKAMSPSISEPDEPLSVERHNAVPVRAQSEPELTSKPEPELMTESRTRTERSEPGRAGPSYLVLEAAAPAAASDWAIPLGSMRRPTLLQSAQRRLAFAFHLVSRSSCGGGALHVQRSPLERLDLDVVELVGQLVMGEATPIDRVLAVAGLASQKAVVVERHLGLVGLMGSSFRLEALAEMCFNKDARHGKHRGKWRSLVSELLLSDDTSSQSRSRSAHPSLLAMTTSITAARYHRQASLRHLTSAEKLIEAKLERAVKALPTGVALRQMAMNDAVTELSRLVKHGADVNSTDDTGCSALWLAAYNSNVRAVVVLLEAGADFELENEAGMTPLIAAACCGCVKTVQVLLEAGADWRKRDTEGGRSAIDWAKSSRTGTAPDPDAVLLLQSWLLEHGTVAEIEGFLDESLRQAVADGVLRTELEVRRLVNSGATVDGVDSAGRCALHLAAGMLPNYETRTRVPTCVALSQTQQPRNTFLVFLSKCETDLFLACAARGDIDAMNALIAAGAALDTTDVDGWTPLMVRKWYNGFKLPGNFFPTDALMLCASRWLWRHHGLRPVTVVTVEVLRLSNASSAMGPTDGCAILRGDMHRKLLSFMDGPRQRRYLKTIPQALCTEQLHRFEDGRSGE